MTRKHRSAYTQPHESFLAATISSIVNQDTGDHSASQPAPYAETSEVNVGYVPTQSLFGPLDSPGVSNVPAQMTLMDQCGSEESQLRVPLDQYLPLPTSADPSLFPSPMFKLPCARQFSLPNAGRSQVIYSAPEVSSAQIPSESRALMEYVKSWSLDAAKRQAEALRSAQVIPETLNVILCSGKAFLLRLLRFATPM
ncbi:unnamed protein product [Echinostoma caproni]|uniref:Uncharacterized protein n=1 Tax=Echinostoma caproni TaxID=27848 RepID=A0A183B0X5_9TREM|nr:unnamed protein product [Echinostoma caproni]